jgi:hypothetical protein
MKAQHEQVEVDRSQTLTEFITEDEINLPPGELYNLINIAVTSDNKLLDTVTHSSYVYLVVLCIVSSVDKLYGCLTWKSNYCFICT